MGLVTVAACVFGALRAGAGTPSWLELKSTHFTVITNSGEKEGRRIAWQFEQIRAVLVRLWPWAHIDRGRPFAVFAVKDEATLKSLGPQYWEGKRYRPTSFWVGGADKQFIALRTDLPEPDEIGANPYSGRILVLRVFRFRPLLPATASPLVQPGCRGGDEQHHRARHGAARRTSAAR